MQKKFFLLRCCGILTALAGFCATEAIADEDSQITILHVQGLDVRELGKSLDSALSDDDVRIQIDAETNILMLKGSKKAVEKTAQLLKVLDPIPRTVTINIEISVSYPENSEDGYALQTPTTYTLVLDTTLRLENARVRRLRARYRAAQVFAMRRLRCRPASVRRTRNRRRRRVTQQFGPGGKAAVVPVVGLPPGLADVEASEEPVPIPRRTQSEVRGLCFIDLTLTKTEKSTLPNANVWVNCSIRWAWIRLKK